MTLNVCCIDDKVSRRNGGHKLIKDRIYTAVKIERLIDPKRYGSFNEWVTLNEIPDIPYFMRRFKPVGKIIINLPDDIQNIDI